MLLLVHVPGREAGAEELKDDELEVGMGIHNEAGSERAKADLPSNVRTMLKYMLDQSDKDRAFLKVSSPDDTVLLINNLVSLQPRSLPYTCQTNLSPGRSQRPRNGLHNHRSRPPAL